MNEYNNKNLKTERINIIIRIIKKRITKDEMKHNEKMNEKL